ncbi:hypothetical protein B0I35DRAFT_512244 [Stachybotrys elegans]|uniref:Uncharacterized protein n=1 Tax=Stachybotrys elegans TaxID=80388 RepID=A0A8K0SRV5_9HYPO|nr:hypothetical protein B0I35DRAFT_512244 [Stachybotrys elegans]
MAPTKEKPAAETSEETPRRRGRPAGSTGGVTKSTSGRGRGRPKSDNPKPAKPYVSTGRPRGRPKGSTKKAGAGASTTPKKPPTLNPDGSVRKRGRPRKSDASTAATTPKSAKAAKKAAEKEDEEAADADAADAEADEDEDLGDENEDASDCK